MAEVKSLDHPVDALPAMLNLTLVDIGKWFRNPISHDPKNLILNKNNVNRVIPSAESRFHDALDEIETEILNAKAVFERDLSLIRSRRAEREKAAYAAAHPTVQKLPEPIETNNDAQKPADEAQAIQPNGDEPKAEEDVVMVDDEPNGPTSTNDLNLTQPQENSETLKSPVEVPKSMPQDTDNSLGLAITLDAPSLPSQPSQPASQQNGNQQNGNQQNGTDENPLSATAMGDADIDSMFADLEKGSADSTLNLDLGLSTADIGTASDDLFGDVNFDEITTSEDLNSLMPGLENIVKDDDNDLTIPNVATANMIAAPPAPTTTAATTTEAQNPATTANNINGTSDQAMQNETAAAPPPPIPPMEDQPLSATAPLDSNFDDLFTDSNFSFEGIGDNDMGGDSSMGDLGDLEDWLKGD